MAMAMMVSTRLWLGGVISPHRDKSLIQALAGQIRAMALCRPLLLAVDGLPSYVKAFQRAFRSKVPRFGQPGRCQGRAWSEIAIVQVVKARTAAGWNIASEMPYWVVCLAVAAWGGWALCELLKRDRKPSRLPSRFPTPTRSGGAI